ncbi:MAG: NAD-dependent dehydratase, partial [Pseudomonadales bacterium]|nr:NAD-dependent dehydratase [Pseudomonadales bacterium]
MMPDKQLLLARLSLSFLWIFTGLTSCFFAPELGYEILAKAGITGWQAQGSVLAGSILDIGLGLWLLSGKALVLCYRLQLIVIVVFTVLL